MSYAIYDFSIERRIRECKCLRESFDWYVKDRMRVKPAVWNQARRIWSNWRQESARNKINGIELILCVDRRKVMLINFLRFPNFLFLGTSRFAVIVLK